jgi:citronellol/citronellal dehydrogenase
MPFTNKTAFITGATRGIGKAIALKLAKHGANIVIAAKSVEENSKLGGTIYSAAKEIEAMGGKALPMQVDIRDEQQIKNAVDKTVETFGGIDILINNASAIQLSGTLETEIKRYNLIQDINVKGTFMVTQACLPHLIKGNNPHILTLSPPINLQSKWMAPHIAYTISKFNMSMMILAWAAEFKKQGIACNALWPKTTIDTAAVRNLLGGEALAKMSRTVDIVADAAFYILNKTNLQYTGNTFIDEEVLANEGITNLDSYSVVPGAKLFTDLFV